MKLRVSQSNSQWLAGNGACSTGASCSVGRQGEWFRLLESLIRTPTDTFGRARRSGAKYVELPAG